MVVAPVQTGSSRCARLPKTEQGESGTGKGGTMHKGQWCGLIALLGAMAVVLSMTSSVLSQKPPGNAPKQLVPEGPPKGAEPQQPGIADAAKQPADGPPKVAEPGRPANE